MIFDTDFIISLMNKNPQALNKLQELMSRKQLQYTTSLTLFELFSGLARSQKTEEEKRKIASVLIGLPILDLDNKSAETGGEIDGALIKEGKMIGAIDCMISGIAITKNLPVITKNIKDFSKIKGLKIETY